MLHLKCGSCAVITAFRNLWKWLNHTAAHCAHGTLLLLCFTGNKAVIYGGISPQRYEVWWSLSMTEWLEFGFGWPQEGEKKKVIAVGFPLHQSFCVLSHWRKEAFAVPCHIWRLSQPAPGQVSPLHPARYQTLERQQKRRGEERGEKVIGRWA